MAANVAFIGCYNVFKAVGELGYLPAAMATRNKRFGTPRVAIVVITVADGAAGDHDRAASCCALGKVFAFGLLGSYAITSISLLVIAWREQRRGLTLMIDGVASVALLIPWVTSLVHQADGDALRRGGHRVAAGGRVRHAPRLDPIGALRLPARRLGGAGRRGGARRRTRW